MESFTHFWKVPVQGQVQVAGADAGVPEGSGRFQFVLVQGQVEVASAGSGKFQKVPLQGHVVSCKSSSGRFRKVVPEGSGTLEGFRTVMPSTRLFMAATPAYHAYYLDISRRSCCWGYHLSRFWELKFQKYIYLFSELKESSGKTGTLFFLGGC